MKARFVYEGLLNEDFKSFDDIAGLSKDIFGKYFDKYGPAEPILEDLDWNWGEIFDHISPLSKFDKKDEYESIKDFINSGIGLIYSSFSRKEGQAGAFFMNPTQYDDPEGELDRIYMAKYPSGIILFNGLIFGGIIMGEDLFAHELQHAYDYWRSKGKNIQTRKEYDRNVILSADPYNREDPDVEKQRKIYYNDTSELSGHFTQVIKGHHWAGWFKGDSKDFGFYSWEEQFDWLKRSFSPWDYLSPKMKKKYMNKFYSYYDKVKDIWITGQWKELEKRGLNFRGNPERYNIIKKPL